MPEPLPEGSTRAFARLSLVALIGANVVVAAQALRWEWGYQQLLLIYWFEALIIGGYNALRMVVVGLVGEQPLGAWLSRWFSVSFGSRLLLTFLGTAFFLVKFGGFVLMTAFWITMVPAFVGSAANPSDRVLAGLAGASQGLVFAIGALLASHGISFGWNFLWRREYATQTVFGLVFWPYLRMAFLLVVVIGGLLFIKLNPGFATSAVMIFALTLLKTALDGMTHAWEHRALASPVVIAPAAEAQVV